MASNATNWRSIRPWSPPLTLSVREITSVSVTFILSTTPSGETDSLLACLGLDVPETEQAEDSDDELKKTSVVSSALASGLSVEVDRSSWRRVFIRIDDKADEAVIIIYGLMPGRQYDVDLELVQGGQKNRLEKRVVTAEGDTNAGESPADSPEVAGTSLDLNSNAMDPTSPSSTSATTPPPTSPGFTPLTLEDRLNQLQHTLSVMAVERESLSTTLKSARRDAQKADANVRSEIDALKRASEKQAAAEHRGKQKVLALQESVKRAQSSSRDIDQEVKGIEGDLPELLKQRAVKEEEYKKVKAEAEKVRRAREGEKEKERKQIESLTGELTGLTHKLERLQGKKEKLENATIPDLEEQLRTVELEIEAEQNVYFASEPQEGMIHGRKTRDKAPWNSPPRNAQRSTSLHYTKTPVLLTNPHRQSSLKATTNTDSNPNSSSTSLASQQHVTSTLSSRAPPFEPGRPMRHLWNKHSPT